MGTVFDEFAILFRPRKGRVTAAVQDEESEVEREERAGEIRDMRTFVSTLAFKKYREMVQHQIDAEYPKPEEGTDVAAARGLVQEGLRRSLRILDGMIRIAEEKLADE